MTQSQAVQIELTSPLHQHNEAVSLDGLDDLFQWAQDLVADGQSIDVLKEKEERIRRQVTETIDRVKKEKAAQEAKDEIAYLQRRVIALFQRVQDLSDENIQIKQVMITQYYELLEAEKLKLEVNRLKEYENNHELISSEQKQMMEALSKLKVERDILDDLLTSYEQENTRLANLLKQERELAQQVQSKRWWHRFYKPKAKKLSLLP